MKFTRNTGYACLALTIFFSCQTPSDRERLDGDWELLQWKAQRDDGSLFYPYGDDAKGQLILNEAGGMAMNLEKDIRPRLGTDDYSVLSDSLIAEAYKGFFSYSGTWSISDHELTFQIQHCKQPDWRGRELKRAFVLSGDTLVISTDNVIGADHELTWVKQR